MFKFVLIILALATAGSAFSQPSPEMGRLVTEATTFANSVIDCANYTLPHQCNNLGRCMKIRELLADGDIVVINEYTTNKNDCACVRSMMGHDYIKRILDELGAKSWDERYKGCYGQ